MDYVRLARRAIRDEECSTAKPSPGAAEGSAPAAPATKATKATKGGDLAEGGPPFLVYSRVLGEHVWLCEDEAHAEDLARELEAEGDHRLIFTVAEVLAMRGMLAADMQTLARIKRLFPGSRIDAVALRTADGEVVQ